MAGYHDSFDELGEPLHEMIHNVEGAGGPDELHELDLQMWDELV